MINPREMLQEFETATAEYINVASSFSQEQFNAVPYEGCWSAAQVTDHLFKSDNGILKALYGPTQTTERAPDENVPGIKKTFLDFTTKLSSPDFIIPDNVSHDKDSLISAFKSVRELLGKAIKTLDLSALCSMPVLGELTRLELIAFVIYHTQRHTHQVTKIGNLVNVQIR
jgi:uncharacterized damage-inducible protein DinB